MELSRDDWMVISRALQDRITALRRSQGFAAGSLRGEEVDHCENLRRIVDAHVDAEHARFQQGLVNLAAS
jgi:hypothetical protein